MSKYEENKSRNTISPNEISYNENSISYRLSKENKSNNAKIITIKQEKKNPIINLPNENKSLTNNQNKYTIQGMNNMKSKIDAGENALNTKDNKLNDPKIKKQAINIIKCDSLKKAKLKNIKPLPINITKNKHEQLAKVNKDNIESEKKVNSSLEKNSKLGTESNNNNSNLNKNLKLNYPSRNLLEAANSSNKYAYSYTIDSNKLLKEDLNSQLNTLITKINLLNESTSKLKNTNNKFLSNRSNFRTSVSQDVSSPIKDKRPNSSYKNTYIKSTLKEIDKEVIDINEKKLINEYLNEHALIKENIAQIKSDKKLKHIPTLPPTKNIPKRNLIANNDTPKIRQEQKLNIIQYNNIPNSDSVKKIMFNQSFTKLPNKLNFSNDKYNFKKQNSLIKDVNISKEKNSTKPTKLKHSRDKAINSEINNFTFKPNELNSLSNNNEVEINKVKILNQNENNVSNSHNSISNQSSNLYGNIMKDKLVNNEILNTKMNLKTKIGLGLDKFKISPTKVKNNQISRNQLNSLVHNYSYNKNDINLISELPNQNSFEEKLTKKNIASSSKEAQAQDNRNLSIHTINSKHSSETIKKIKRLTNPILVDENNNIIPISYNSEKKYSLKNSEGSKLKFGQSINSLDLPELNSLENININQIKELNDISQVEKTSVKRVNFHPKLLPTKKFNYNSSSKLNKHKNIPNTNNIKFFNVNNTNLSIQLGQLNQHLQGLNNPNLSKSFKNFNN